MRGPCSNRLAVISGYEPTVGSLNRGGHDTPESQLRRRAQRDAELFGVAAWLRTGLT